VLEVKMTEGSFIEIPATVFQSFGHGENVEVAILKNRHPCIHDVFWWACAQFTGLARVEEIVRFHGNDVVCRISKLN
jgi:hypothetical protein